MKKLSQITALILAAVMVLSLTACGSKEPEKTTENPGTTAQEEETTQAEETETSEAVQDLTLVYAVSAYSQNLDPFFYTSVYDAEIVEKFTGFLLGAGRGAVVNGGIAGDDYIESGMGAIEVVQNEDGTVDYNLTMRDDIKFSDGVGATIDDVIFGIYVCCDPNYDGPSTLYALPIEGMNAYRKGLGQRGKVIFDDGPNGYTEIGSYTEEQYNTFWNYYNNDARIDFVKEICDFCVAEGRNKSDDSVAAFAASWGFTLGADASYEDFWNAIVANYASAEEAEASETAGSNRFQLTMAALGSEYETVVKTRDGADNIAGIVKTGDYTMTIHMTAFDAAASTMNFAIVPLHWYGDASLYDYDNNSFGFTKGDLASVKAKSKDPLGCGPYVYQGYDNGDITFKANPNYCFGAPEFDTVILQATSDFDSVPGLISGSFDVATPVISEAVLTTIKGANENGELKGDVLYAHIEDYNGYGYIGISAEHVKAGDDAGSDASKALRKGFMTLFSAYRDAAVSEYYGDYASVIQYPISDTSWAAPKASDNGYESAYSKDAEGSVIYTDGMSEEERQDAAKKAAVTWFKAAGLTYDDAAGKFTDAAETYEIFVPGQGEKDHPAYGIVVEASKVLEELGIRLLVTDVDTESWSEILATDAAMMWAGAWKSTADPDMTQVYAGSNYMAGTKSNYFAIRDNKLDELIAKGRASADQEGRKSVYKECFDIVLDWGVELPFYQRKECVIVSSQRVGADTVPSDMTLFFGGFSGIEMSAVK